ncbi:GroES-like protein [Xylariaceae sp. AK1471]|nr:GroES-like protein [Xylariaceae sp. AK1471]
MDNSAAFLVSFGRIPFDIDEAEPRFPDENELVIKNAAVSVNAVDVWMQSGWDQIMNYPAILGADVAGEVVEVGSEIRRFSVGDRVMGHALRLATEDDRHAAYQKYTVLMPNMACSIPSSLSYENAATMPLGISTSSAALFQDDFLNLEPPVLYPQNRDSWVIVSGATGNVGSHAVRLASAAGYKVLALASQDKFALAKQLGATEIVNSRPKAPDTLPDLVAKAMSGRTIMGAFDATGNDGALVETAKAVDKCNGRKFVAAVAGPEESIPPGVEVKAVLAIEIRNNKVGKMVWEDFLPDAMAMGKYFLPYPKAFVFGEGLDKIQDAISSKAPAGEKPVVTIE